MSVILDQIKNALQSEAMKIAAFIVAIAIVIAVALKFHLLALLWHSRWLPVILIAIAALLVFAIIFWGFPGSANGDSCAGMAPDERMAGRVLRNFAPSFVKPFAVCANSRNSRRDEIQSRLCPGT
jgi:fatty acid desaturase